MLVINKKVLLLFLLILVGGIIRFYKLSEHPIQLNHDEVSQIYDTKSIVETGRDIYGKVLPLAFFSTGDYKVGHYIYISTISYLLFGDKEITIRIPAAFFGTLTILGVFLFIYTSTKNYTLAFLSAFLVAITPSEIFYSRKSFENVIGVSLVFFGLTFLSMSLKKIKGKPLGFLGALSIASAMYVYTSHTIVVPILVLLFSLSYIKIIRTNFKFYLYLLVFWIILILPLIYLTFLNSDIRFRAASVFITQDINLGKQLEHSQLQLKTYMDYLSSRYLNQYNPIYIFGNGLNLTNQGIIGIGPLLLIQLPFLIIGIIFILKDKKISHLGNFLFGFAAISMIPSAITFEEFSPHRAMLSFTVLSIISAFGLYWMIQFVNASKLLKLNIKRMIFIVLNGMFLLNFVYFIRIYTVSYPFEKSEHLHYPFKQISQFVWSEYNNFNQIIFDPKFGQIAPKIGVGAHYYIAYYGNYSPAKFQKEYRVGMKERELLFDKFSIREIDWREDQNLTNALFIGSSWSIPIDSIPKDKIIKTFYFYNNQPAFYAVKL